MRFETRDANFRWIMALILGAVGLGILIFAVLRLFLFQYAAYQAEIKGSAYPLASASAEALPAGPRLEQVDRMAGVVQGDVRQRHAAEQAVLDSYGPTSEAGYIHVPIDRAMRLVRGKLRSRPPSVNPRRKQNGLVDGGEPNSGRMVRDKPKWDEP